MRQTGRRLSVYPAGVLVYGGFAGTDEVALRLPGRRDDHSELATLMGVLINDTILSYDLLRDDGTRPDEAYNASAL